MSKKPQRRKKPQEITPAKKRLFTAILVLIPVLLLLLVEFSLRIFKIGHDVSLFETSEIGGRTYAMVNPNVAERYFSRLSFHPAVSTDAITIPKEPGTFRIFCLGASTTIGYPYGPAGAFPTLLRERLQATFPDRRFEVMNLGITATNSFTTLDLARDIMSYEPDAIIVYDGHNEFYGALGVASQEAFAGSRWLTSLYLKLVRLRTFLVLRDTYNSIRAGSSGGPGNETGTMMERVARGQYVPLHSDTYTSALEAFRSNVYDLVALCSSKRVPLILSTQVSNLRDLPPFIPGDSPALPAERREQLHALLEKGKTDLAAGKRAEAVELFRQAWMIDSTRADVAYMIGKGLDVTGTRGESRPWYVRARDLDQLRFRMSSEFNDLVRAKGSENGILIADIEQMFSRSSPDSIVGSSLMLEHVHPNARGYFLMAKEYARLLRENGLVAPADAWAKNDTISDAYFWDHRVATELDERAAARRVAYLTAGWPFRSGDSRVVPVPSTDTLGTLAEEMITKVKTWEEAHIAAAAYYEQRGDLRATAGEYRMLMKMEPYNSSAYLLLARTLVRLNEYPGARQVLERSIDIEPTVYACRTLGSVALSEKRFSEAAGYFERGTHAEATDAERSELYFLMGLAQFRNNEAAAARTSIETALKINQYNQQAMQLLERINSVGQ